MKKLFIAFAVCIFLITTKLFAGEIAGGQLYYNWLSGNIYKAILIINVECSGGQEPDSVALCYYPTCGTVAPVTTYMFKSNIATNGEFVGGKCAARSNQCLSPNSSFKGYRAWQYEVNIILPIRCSKWIITASPGSRTFSENLQSSSTSAAFVCELNDSASQNNSSPRFISNPSVTVGTNYPFAYIPIVTDPDGDSISFHLIEAKIVSGGCNTVAVAFSNPSYTPFNPWGPFVGFDPVTGQLVLANTQEGTYSITLQAIEHKGNNQPVTVTQEVIVNVDSAANTYPTPGPTPSPLIITNLVGGIQANGQIEAQPLVPISFCFGIKSPYSLAYLIGLDNTTLSTPGSVVNYIGSSTDSLTACYSWTPQANDFGTRILSFTVRDTFCGSGALSFTQNFIVTLYVLGGTGIPIIPFSASAVQIFPNPATESIFIKAQQHVDASLMSVEGKVVLRVKDTTSLDVKALAEGQYFLKVMDAKTRLLLTTEKVVIKR